MTKLLFLSGSTRKNSVNTKLAKAALESSNRHRNVTTTWIDLADYDMPIYNGDNELEHGLPEKAIALKKEFTDHDGFFIASPEYNSSFSALLKNSLDWISRPHEENELPLIAFSGKIAAIASASPGRLGGIRGLIPLRMMLSNINVIVTPQQLAVSQAFNAFDDHGNLTNKRTQDQLNSLINDWINILQP